MRVSVDLSNDLSNDRSKERSVPRPVPNDLLSPPIVDVFSSREIFCKGEVERYPTQGLVVPVGGVVVVVAVVVAVFDVR